MKRRLRALFHGPFAFLAAALYVLLVVPHSRLRVWRRRRAGRLPVIARAATPIANLRWYAEADRRHGYASETIAYHLYRAEDRAAFDHSFDRLTRVRFVGQLVPYAVFVWAGFRYDLFWFTYDGGLLGETPFWRLELPLLALAGKRVVGFPYGGDARLATPVRARGGWHAFSDVPPGSEDRDERQVRARLGVFARWADVMVGSQDNVLDLPRMDDIVRLPIDVDEWRVQAPGPGDGLVTVVHAPNHRHYKGTRFLEDAVDELRREGLPLELVLVEGTPAAEARRIYATADVVADQFLLGAYGFFALEGMALGKPVLCHLDERVAAVHPEWAELPIVSATPDTLVDELRKLVLDAELRAELGRRGAEFVRRHHTFETVGAQMDRINRRAWFGL